MHGRSGFVLTILLLRMKDALQTFLILQEIQRKRNDIREPLDCGGQNDGKNYVFDLLSSLIQFIQRGFDVRNARNPAIYTHLHS